MSLNKLDSIFTHCEALDSREPETKTIQTIKIAEASKITGSDSVSILRNGCLKVFGDVPIYEEKVEKGRFSARCIIGGWIGVDTGFSKKSVKQKATKKVLLAIIKDNRHKEFGIPGDSKEEAQEFINCLRLDLETETEDKGESWISKCNELRQKKKLSNIITTFREDSEPLYKTFYCTVKLDEHVGNGVGRLKKAAQNEACKELYESLHRHYVMAPPDSSKNVDNNHEADSKTDTVYNTLDANNKLNNSVLSSASTTLNSTEQTVDSSAKARSGELASGGVGPIPLASAELCKCLKRAIEVGEQVNYRASMTLLNEIVSMKDPIIKKVFDVKSKESIKFSFVDVRTTDGQIQVFLEVQNSAKFRPENIFGGQGLTKIEAMDDAAWQALRYLYLFGNFEKIIAEMGEIENEKK